MSYEDALAKARAERERKRASASSSTGLGEWDASDDKEPPPPRGWLFGNIFARRFISMLVAEGGTGKTALRYAQYVSMALGRSLTGEHVFCQCRVLIVSLEDDADELRRRIRAVCLHYNIDLAKLKGWLFLAAPGAGVGKLMVLDAKGRAAPGTLATTLDAVIVARKIDLVALDPFIKSHAVSENDNNAVDQVAQLLADLAHQHDLAVDLSHHVRKGAAEPGNADRGRGASAAKDAARLVYSLTTMTPDEAKAFEIPEAERRSYVRMDSAKVNIAPPMGKATWFKLVGVQLGNGKGNELYPNGDTVQTVEPWSPPETWGDLSTELLNRILDVIDKGMANGSRYSAARSATERAAWKVVLQHAPTKTEKQAREIVNSWVANGVLVEEGYDDPVQRRRRSGVRVAARPGNVAS
jgi:hypothetical protein